MWREPLADLGRQRESAGEARATQTLAAITFLSMTGSLIAPRKFLASKVLPKVLADNCARTAVMLRNWAGFDRPLSWNWCFCGWACAQKLVEDTSP